MSGNIIEATEKDFTQLVDTTLPIVIDFWAEWCSPCKRLTPVIEELAAEMDGQVKFIKINVDNNQEIASQYQVMSIPTLIFLKNGQEVDRMVGAAGKDSLVKKIKTLFH
ncbi:MAG: thioredoxin [Candidatus Omnitrophica bacterium]|nr:thioredoxin [Candidatus Omnitrophota bacterium]